MSISIMKQVEIDDGKDILKGLGNGFLPDTGRPVVSYQDISNLSPVKLDPNSTDDWQASL